MCAVRGVRAATLLVAGLLAMWPATATGQAVRHPRTAEAREAFLEKADVVEAKQLGKGVTKPWRLTLREGAFVQDAAFQDVDAHKEEARFRSGRTERDFRDFYGYNIAAYRLARLLGYDDLVPVSIERVWKGRRGALTWWVDKKWDEDERVKAGVEPPDVPGWERQLYLARAFTALVADTDRNLGNQLVTADFHLWLIDFTRAFRHTMDLKSTALLRRVDRRFYDRLKALRDEDVDAALSAWVDPLARKALLSRRDAMIEHFATLVDQRGDQSTVFYESDSKPHRPQEQP
ncbi:MAG: hypothetical protein ABIT71_02000 [Vicinamibacteraceae bacterium]